MGWQTRPAPLCAPPVVEPQIADLPEPDATRAVAARRSLGAPGRLRSKQQQAVGLLAQALSSPSPGSCAARRGVRWPSLRRMPP